MNYCTVMQAFVALPIGAESRFQPGRKKPTLDEAAWRSFVEEVLGWVAESARACKYYVCSQVQKRCVFWLFIC